MVLQANYKAATPAQMTVCELVVWASGTAHACDTRARPSSCVLWHTGFGTCVLCGTALVLIHVLMKVIFGTKMVSVQPVQFVPKFGMWVCTLRRYMYMYTCNLWLRPLFVLSNCGCVEQDRLKACWLSQCMLCVDVVVSDVHACHSYDCCSAFCMVLGHMRSSVYTC